MESRTFFKTSISRAGWLFADLSIVLMILFAASTVKTSDPCKDKPKVAKECQVSDSTLPSDGDGSEVFKPKPIEIDIRNGSRMSGAGLIELLNKKIDESGIKTSHFGVIIIYGGSKGVDNSLGDRNARKAQMKLSSSWTSVRDITFFEIGHTSDLRSNDLRLKLFPYLQSK